MTLVSTLLSMIDQDISDFSIQHDNSICSAQSQEISKAIKHPLEAGGKRIRPLLVLLMAGAFGGEKSIQIARKSALAMELIHTYSLVHDDLPCMDNDDYRRGKPTVHKVYGEAKGLLVGDALLTQAFLVISQTDWKGEADLTSHLVQTLAESSGASGMIWGQWLDMTFAGQQNITWEQLETVHQNKTGKLLGASLELGVLCASCCDDEIRKQARRAGILLGLAFQIMDDILDVTKSSADLGKTAKKDVDQNKVTAVSLLGMETAKRYVVRFTEQTISLLKKILPESNENYRNELFKLIGGLISREF
jgi:geranylgeranyl pyrophosphate synthase